MRAVGIALIIAAVVVVIAVVLIVMSHVVPRVRARRQRKRDRDVPWTPYCRLSDAGMSLHVGVERVTEDGRVLGRVLMRSVPADDEIERAVAEGAAKVRAHSYNESKVGM